MPDSDVWGVSMVPQPPNKRQRIDNGDPEDPTEVIADIEVIELLDSDDDAAFVAPQCDPDVEIIEVVPIVAAPAPAPPPTPAPASKAPTMPTTSPGNTNDDIEAASVVRAAVVYPHARADCPKCSFDPVISDAAHALNVNKCAKCYCYVCDSLVSECPSWDKHCMAIDKTNAWRKLRMVTKARKVVQPVPNHLLPPCARLAGQAKRSFSDEQETTPVAHDSFHRRDWRRNGAGIDAFTVQTANNRNGTSYVDPFARARDRVREERRRVAEEYQKKVAELARARRERENSELLADLKSMWQPGQIKLRNRTLEQMPLSPRFPAEQRLLLGKIDFWRPNCSHISAHSLGPNVGATTCNGKALYVEAQGHRASVAKIMAREVGVNLLQTKSDHISWPRSFLDDEGHKAQKELGCTALPSFSWSDKTAVDESTLESLKTCMSQRLVEVRWELVHYPGAKNQHKRLGASFDMEQKEVCSGHVMWLRDCRNRLEGVGELTSSNCCCLRAWVYVLPPAIGSNNVSAANAFGFKSLYSACDALDGGEAVVTNLWGGGQVTDEVRRSALAVGARPTTLPLAVNEHYCKYFAAVMTALDLLDLSTASPSSIQVASGTGIGVTSPKFSRWLERHPHLATICYTFNSSKDGATYLANTAKFAETMSADVNSSSAVISIDTILKSPLFAVSNGYEGGAAPQPPLINVPLRPYQLESLKWMEDQERKRSISDPFWVEIEVKPSLYALDAQKKTLWYCPLTGSLAGSPPPPLQGGILGEDMGLGKTILTAALICNSIATARAKRPVVVNNERPDLMLSPATLITCPPSLLKQWENELENRVEPRLRVLRWYGPSRPTDRKVIADHDVVLTTYGVLSGGKSEVLRRINWFRVVADESTYLKGGANAACFNSLIAVPSRRRWGVSGTPLSNRMSSFHSMMRFLGVSPFAHVAHYSNITSPCNHGPSAFRRPSNSSFQFQSLVFSAPALSYFLKSIMIRHVKEQELHGEPLLVLPPATGRLVSITLSAEERKVYDVLEANIASEARSYLGSEKAAASNIIVLRARMLPLRLMTDGMYEKLQAYGTDLSTTWPAGASKGKSEPSFNLPHTGTSARMRRVKTMASNPAKIRQLIKDVKAIRENDPESKLVVFTEFLDIKAAIKKALDTAGFHTCSLEGSQTAGRRGQVLKQFAEDVDTSVLVLSMRTGAVGLTLTMANVVILFDGSSLELATEDQAINRVNRIGQTRPVLTLTYVAKDTIDERMANVRRKRGQPPAAGEVAPSSGNSNLSHLDVYREVFKYSVAS